MNRFFSFIVPVYNRPEELTGLLASLCTLDSGRFEVVVIEDGSDQKSDEVIGDFKGKLDIQYLILPRSGPSKARNAGMAAARGDYFIFIDSDCLVPSHYLAALDAYLNGNALGLFGGPDRSAADFSLVQKAISCAMTSFLTTGGIRGGRKQVGKFYPRSFNMGISRAAYESAGGFPDTRMHPGEDMVYAIELIRKGLSSGLIPEAYVYHKRRTSFRKFFRQVYGFGKTRYIISRVYPETFRLFFLFPTLFVAGVIALVILSFLSAWLWILPFLLWSLMILVDATVRQRNLAVGILAVLASLIQLTGYGTGFFKAWVEGGVLGRDEYGVFDRGFYPGRS